MTARIDPPIVTPVRLQLSRRKGFNLQEHSRAVNGLAAVNCARPGIWGNLYIVGVYGWSAEDCVFAHREATESDLFFAKIIRYNLGGKNLACWCGLDHPCHADTLLEIANK